MNRFHTRFIALSLSLSMVVFGVGSSRASLAPAVTTQTTASRTQDLSTVQRFLEEKEVGQHLSRLQLTPNEIESRLGSLSDHELHQVAQKIEQQNPGQDSVTGILVVVILVLLIIYLLKRV